MSRREQIEEAAKEIVEKWDYKIPILSLFEMAEWADSHPNITFEPNIFEEWQTCKTKLAIAVRALKESRMHFNSIMSGLTTHQDMVEHLTKSLAHDAGIEIDEALAKIGEK